MPEETALFGASCKVWLLGKSAPITAMIIRQDESTAGVDVTMQSLAGVKGEITGFMIRHGYKPAGDWDQHNETETVREFSYRESVPVAKMPEGFHG